MAADKAEIRRWFERGKGDGAAFMLVACDTYSWEDYPVHCASAEALRARAAELHGPNMQKVMECYDLSMDMELQLSEARAWHGWKPADPREAI